MSLEKEREPFVCIGPTWDVGTNIFISFGNSPPAQCKLGLDKWDTFLNLRIPLIWFEGTGRTLFMPWWNWQRQRENEKKKRVGSPLLTEWPRQLFRRVVYLENAEEKYSQMGCERVSFRLRVWSWMWIIREYIMPLLTETGTKYWSIYTA